MRNASDSTAMGENFPDFSICSSVCDPELSSYDCFNSSLWNATNCTDADADADGDAASEWCEAGDQEDAIKVFQSCSFCLIFLLGVAGNGLVIATFALYRRLRLRSMTDVFLFHLALADLLLLCTLPLQAVETHRGWVFPAHLCRATRACYAVNTYSGLLLLASISVDRYLVVARAQEVLRLRGRILRGGKLAALGVWVAAVLLSLPEILYSGVSGVGEDAHCGMATGGRVKMATNGAITGVFCLSLLVMVACYSAIARVLWEGGAGRRWGRGQRRHGRQWHRQRTLKLMVALVLAFLALQLPYTVVLSRRMAGQVCALLLEYATRTLAYARCCLNPILYALVGVRFRSDVLRLVRELGCSRRGGGPGPAPGRQASSTSASSPSSPALTALSPCSPTPQGHTKFKFSGTK